MTADDQQHPAERPTPAIILGIPGRWKDRTKLVEDIATKSAGYVFAGGVMLHVPTQQGFQVDVGPHDPRIIEAFKLIGQKTLTRQDYKNIERHTFMLYLTAPGGSIAAARQVMAAGAGLLNAGRDGHGIAGRRNDLGLLVVVIAPCQDRAVGQHGQ